LATTKLLCGLGGMMVPTWLPLDNKSLDTDLSMIWWPPNLVRPQGLGFVTIW